MSKFVELFELNRNESIFINLENTTKLCWEWVNGRKVFVICFCDGKEVKITMDEYYNKLEKLIKGE